MSEVWGEVPMSVEPIPVPCGAQTIASFTVREFERDNGFLDREVTVTRSCGHLYFSSGTPTIGARAMTCLGPQIETARSGRADPTLPPLHKGKRWTRLKGAAA